MKQDERLELLAQKVLENSVHVTCGEKVYLDFTGAETLPFLNACIRIIAQKGAVPYPVFRTDEMWGNLLNNASEEVVNLYSESYAGFMHEMDVCIRVVGSDNPYDMSSMSEQGRQAYQQIFMNKVHMGVRIPHTRWCILRYPTPARAAVAGMSTAAYEDFFFQSCLLDYQRMSAAMDPLVELMNMTDKVRIVAPGTDLSFSIEGIPASKCVGYRNLPDGEVFTSPVRNSVEGKVTFNTQTKMNGVLFKNISLEFKQGRVVKASSLINDRELQAILDSDEGARYTGEFAFGVNPYILRETGENLFDEKINGSFHIALGSSFVSSDNGNRSAIHWDLVQIQTEACGGGEIYFDDMLIRKNGEFVPNRLWGLNEQSLR